MGTFPACVNCVREKCVCKASDSTQGTVVIVGFYLVSTSSICEGVLSLVNYTNRCQGDRNEGVRKEGMSSGSGCGAGPGCYIVTPGNW